MRILFIVPYTPSLIRTRPYNLIQGLRNRGHQVTLATLWSSEEELDQLGELAGTGVEVIAKELQPWRSFWNCLKAIQDTVPLQGWYCWQPQLAQALLVELQKRSYAVVHVEHLRGVRYALALTNGNNGKTRSGVPIVWDSVDCISHLFHQAQSEGPTLKTRLIAGMELNRTCKYEAWLANRLNRILVTSEADQQAFLELGKDSNGQSRLQERLSILPNGVDLDYFCPNGERRQPSTLVFSGKMSYHANVAAALHLLREIMPGVWSRCPDVKLWIVGKEPPRELKALANGRVHLTGLVDDLRPYLRGATVAVSPVVYGAGIQNKVLEALACATPTVATSRATAALDVIHGHELVIADQAESFSQAIVDLLEQPEKRTALGRQGRKFVEKNHSWDAITTQLEEIYGNEIEGQL